MLVQYRMENTRLYIVVPVNYRAAECGCVSSASYTRNESDVGDMRVHVTCLFCLYFISRSAVPSPEKQDANE